MKQLGSRPQTRQWKSITDMTPRPKGEGDLDTVNEELFMQLVNVEKETDFFEGIYIYPYIYSIYG